MKSLAEVSKAIAARRAEFSAEHGLSTAVGGIEIPVVHPTFRTLALYRAVAVSVARAYFDRGYKCKDSEL